MSTILDFTKALIAIDRSHLPSEYMLDVMRIICENFNYDFSFIVEFDKDGGGLIVSSHDPPDGYLEQLENSTVFHLSGSLCKQIKKKEVLSSSSPFDEPVFDKWREMLKSQNIENMICVQLINTLQTPGILVFQNTEDSKHSKEDIMAIQLAAIVISHSLICHRHSKHLAKCTEEPRSVIIHEYPDTNSEKKLLIIDDNVDFGNVIAKMVTAIGYTARFVESGNEAYEILKQKNHGFCAALMDIYIPGEESYDRFATVRKLVPDIKIIACTGYGAKTKGLIERLQNDNLINGILHKPFQIEILQDLLSHNYPIRKR